MINVAISGATGRMGKMLIEAAVNAQDINLCAALSPAGLPEIGTDPAAFLGKSTGLGITADLDAINQSQVLIDFTRPEATMMYLEHCVKNGVAMVIGTTGFDAEGKAKIAEAAKSIPIVFAPNMSVGVNAAIKLVEIAAKLLADYDCDILEMHHKHKVDAPSGTALQMGRAVAKARGQVFEDVAVLSREGHTGERKDGEIGFATLRGGDVVGDHTVIFAATGERIEISHKSGSRAGYANGSMAAARFLQDKKCGLYSMTDVLGL